MVRRVLWNPLGATPVNDKLLEVIDVPTLRSVIRTGDESVIETTRLDQEIEATIAPYKSQEDELELLIDDVVDRHITALRQDIRTLLERARNLP